MSLISFFKTLFIFREKGREGERERNTSVWLPLMCPLLRTWPTTEACALTVNRTSDPLIHRAVLSPLSYTSLGLAINILQSLFLAWSDSPEENLPDFCLKGIFLGPAVFSVEVTVSPLLQHVDFHLILGHIQHRVPLSPVT